MSSTLAGQQSILKIKTRRQIYDFEFFIMQILGTTPENVVWFHVFHLVIFLRCAEVVKIDLNVFGSAGTHFNLLSQTHATCSPAPN